MSLPNTESLTTGFPLVIPTYSQQPTARLVLRNNRGQVVQQWLVKQNKCTLGSGSSCGLRCDIPGIAPYHALLVIGARQVFIRALAPKLTRDGRPFNEILLTDEESHFEIAGHRFELSRKGETVSSAAAAERAKPERLKFTLARPFELNGRKAAPTAVVLESQAQAQITPASPANFDSRWVAQLIQSAIEPLESQLHNLLRPLNELQSESRKQRRVRKKRQSARLRESESKAVAGLDLPPTAPNVSQQVEELVVKHSAAMDILTERISDVNQQLSAIERIIAAEREVTTANDVSAEDPQLARQSQAIEELQSGIGAVTATLQILQTQQLQESGNDLKWKSTIQKQLAGVTQVVDSLSATVAEMHALAIRQTTPEQREQDLREERQWKVDVQERLVGLSQVIDSLSLNVVDIHKTTLAEATPEQEQQAENERHWKTDVKQQLAGINQVIDTLANSVAEVHRSAFTEPTLEQLQQQQQQRGEELQWKSSMHQELAGLTQVIDSLSMTVAEILSATLSEKANPASPPPTEADQVWQSEVRQQLAGLSQVIDSLSTDVAEIRTTTLNDQIERQPNPAQAADQEWQCEVRQQLAGLSQVIDSLSANVAEIRTTTLNDQMERQSNPAQAADQAWQSEVRQQLAGLSQVIDSLSANVAEIRTTTLNDQMERQSNPAQAADQEWQSEVRQQLAGLSQVIDSLSATVTEVQNIAVDKASAPTDMISNVEQQPQNDLWALGSTVAEPGLDSQLNELTDQVAVESDIESAADSELTWPEPMPAATDNQSMWEMPVADVIEGVTEDTSADTTVDAHVDEFHFGGQLATPAQPVEDRAESTLPAVEESEGAVEEAGLYPTTTQAARADETETVSANESESTWSDLFAGLAGASNFTIDPKPGLASVEAVAADSSSLNDAQDLQTPASEQIDDALPSWWREDDEQFAKGDMEVAHENNEFNFMADKNLEFDDEQLSRFNGGAYLGTAKDDDSVEFFGLTQFESAEEVFAEAVAPSVEVSDLASQESPATVDEELIGLGEAGTQPYGQHSSSGALSVPSEAEEQETLNRDEEEVVVTSCKLSPVSEGVSLESSEEDDSVEDYMRKLLARMRGVPEEQVELAKPAPTQAVTKASVAEDKSTLAPGADETVQSSAPRTTVATPKTALDSLEVTEPFDPEKYMPRALAPERTLSLAAMRELANSSARTAINKSTRQRHVSSIVLKTVIASVGLFVGMILVIMNGFNMNIGLVATVASFLVAAIWGYDSITSIRPMLQAGLILRPEASNKVSQAEEPAE